MSAHLRTGSVVGYTSRRVEPADQHGSTLRDEPGVGPIAAAALLCGLS